jgi:radical SAM superfamily enzyme YgiQ (UPF0313 family)
MDYDGNIFRPPAEHNSILLQVTVGCSHNKCDFCGLYKDKKFRIKSSDEIRKDLEYASANFRNVKRLFLCDGDALIIPQERLVAILEDINLKLPHLVRIGTYANAKSIGKKTPAELAELKKRKLSIIYLGLESGDDEVLKDMHKGIDVDTQIREGLKVKEAGMKLSCTVLLGIAGRKRSLIHAEKTGIALSKMDPNYASALSLMMLPEVPLYDKMIKNEFDLITPIEILEELKIMIENTDLTAGVFSANHASNYLPLQIRIPGGKQDAIDMLNKAMDGRMDLKPEWQRGI